MANSSWDPEVEFYSSLERAHFPLDSERHLQKWRKIRRKLRYRVTFNQQFEAVMRGCQDRPSTWISDEIIRAFTACHEAGWGFSAEAWHDEELVGGVYGLTIGGAIFAESMFSARSGGSKAALVALLIEAASSGMTLFDVQVQNPHLKLLGSAVLTPDEYQERLNAALPKENDFCKTLNNLVVVS